MKQEKLYVRVASVSPRDESVWLGWSELNAALAEGEAAVRQEHTHMGRYALYEQMGNLCYSSGTAYRAIQYWTRALGALYDADYEDLSRDHREQAYYIAERIDTTRRRHKCFRYLLSARRDVNETYRDINCLRWGE